MVSIYPLLLQINRSLHASVCIKRSSVENQIESIHVSKPFIAQNDVEVTPLTYRLVPTFSLHSGTLTTILSTSTALGMFTLGKNATCWSCSTTSKLRKTTICFPSEVASTTH